MVDSGAIHLCIPELVRQQLGLTTIEQRRIKTADGAIHLVDYVAPIMVEIFGRHSSTGALVMGEQVLLGAIPMEDMDLVVEPLRQRVIPNPASPDVPMSLAMGFLPR